MDGKRPTAREIRGNCWVHYVGTAREDQAEIASGVGRRSAFDQGGYVLNERRYRKDNFTKNFR